MIEKFRNSFAGVKLPINGVRLPTFQLEEEYLKKINCDDKISNFVFLQRLCLIGLKEKGLEKNEKYLERLRYELETLHELSFTDYILLVWDVINFCKENEIPVGLGRGSAAGSLTLYCIGVTGIDPVKYDLFFERFVSKTRAKKQVIDGVTYLDGSLMVDVDLDICYYNRPKVLEYINTKFKGNTSKILTLNTLSGKLLIKECGKIVDEKEESEMNHVTSLIPKIFGQVKDIDEAYGEVEEFADWCNKNPRTFNIAKKLKNLNKNRGVHASGMLVSYDKLVNQCPTELDSCKAVVSSYDMNWVSLINVKLDLLGLRSVSVVNEACKQIGITPADIDFNDVEIYQNLQELETPHGLFQIEADTNYKVCKTVKPRNIEQLSAVLALARPGALNYVDKYASYVNNGTYDSIHPFFDDILEYTGGVCLAGDSLVFDASSGEFVEISNKKIESGKSVSLDKNNNICSRKIKKWIPNGRKMCYSLETKQGRIIQATKTHKFLTPYGWKELKDIKSGDLIASPKKLIRDFEPISIGGCKSRILGLLLGDGSLTSGSAVDFVSKNKMLIQDYRALAECGFKNTQTSVRQQIREVSRIESKKKNGKYHESSDLLRWLRELGLKDVKRGRSSRDKFIPEIFYKSKESDIKNLLSGLWDSDGGENKTSFYYKTVSDKLAVGVQNLLLILGIDSSIYRHQGVCQVTVFDKNSFSKNIGSFLKRLSPQKSYPYEQKLGLPTEIVSSRVSLSGISKRKIGRETGLSRNVFRFKCKTVSFANCKKIAEYLNDNVLLNLCNTNWQTVSVVKEVGVKEVFDLSIDSDHNFSANNIIVHNCLFQEQMMKMAHKIGFTLDEAEILRRIVGKKKVDQVAEWQQKIKDKVKENNLDPTIGEVLWRVLEDSANYSFNKCVFESEEVELINGKKVQLKDVNIGDKVKAYDTDNDRDHYVEVLDVIKGKKMLYEVEFEDGKKIRTSMDHKFLCEDLKMRPLKDIIANGHDIITG